MCFVSVLYVFLVYWRVAVQTVTNP